MPGYRAHLVGGFSLYTMLVYGLRHLRPTPLTLLEWLGFALAGSLFPDVDTKSKGQLWFYRMLIIVLALFFSYGHHTTAVCLSMICITPLMVRHRGLFHRPWFIVLMPCALLAGIGSYAPTYTTIFVYDILFFIVGALSHIWLDIGFVRMIKKKF